jgi:hypothetical protein
MELDDFKKKKLNYHSSEPENETGYEERVDCLISIFKSYQKKHRKKVVVMIAVNTSLAMIYLLNMIHKTGLNALGYSMIGAGFIIGAAYLFIRYKTFSPGTYSLPITEFLLRAEKKISYCNLTDYLTLIPILLVLGTGGGLVFVTSLLKYTDNAVLLIIIWIIFFLALSVFGFVAGRKNWEKEYGPLFQKIIEMKNNYSLKQDQVEQTNIVNKK